MKHPKRIKGFSSLAGVAYAVSVLRYDALRDFLDYLAVEIKQQSKLDKSFGKKKLAKALNKLSKALDNSVKNTDEVWKICEPFMTKNKKKKRS